LRGRRAAADPLERAGVGDEPVDPLLDRGRAGSVARLPDDVDGLRVALGEALLQQLGRCARLASGRRVVGRPVAGESCRAERGDEPGDPDGDDRAAAAERQVGEPREAARGEGDIGEDLRGRGRPLRCGRND
jgi:hypothetical protein